MLMALWQLGNMMQQQGPGGERPNSRVPAVEPADGGGHHSPSPGECKEQRLLGKKGGRYLFPGKGRAA